MAGSIAYQAFISLIPLLVLVFFLVSVVGDEGLASQVTRTTQGFLPAAGNELLEDAISGSVATTGGTAIGLVTLLWGSLKIFRGLDTAFSEIYESTGEASFVDQLRDAFVVFFAIGLALLAAAVASVVFAVFSESTLIGLLNPAVLVVGLTLAFVPMYYYFPDVETTVREILPGAVVAAIGWAALQGLFQVYVSVTADSASAGPIGAILLLLSWLYFGGLVLLIGAVVNAARSGHLPPTDPPSTARPTTPSTTIDRGDSMVSTRLPGRNWEPNERPSAVSPVSSGRSRTSRANSQCSRTTWVPNAADGIDSRTERRRWKRKPSDSALRIESSAAGSNARVVRPGGERSSESSSGQRA